MRIVSFFFFSFWDSRFTIFEIIFILLFWNKNFKWTVCAKVRLLLIDRVEIISDKSSCSQMFFKTGDFKNSTISTRKVALKFFIKKRLEHWYFREYCEIFQNNFCYRTPVAAFELTLHILWMIELIAFSLCAMW